MAAWAVLIAGNIFQKVYPPLAKLPDNQAGDLGKQPGDLINKFLQGNSDLEETRSILRDKYGVLITTQPPVVVAIKPAGGKTKKKSVGCPATPSQPQPTSSPQKQKPPAA